ncbi:hypothetical protein Sjap_012815 [Stephania japonica]|uniref:Uncharacterized protein n=1 Tax=Stephania japonica TaxID=461633 RepID=A0AAP0IYK1_9MAGN
MEKEKGNGGKEKTKDTKGGGGLSAKARSQDRSDIAGNPPTKPTGLLGKIRQMEIFGKEMMGSIKSGFELKMEMKRASKDNKVGRLVVRHRVELRRAKGMGGDQKEVFGGDDYDIPCKSR